MLLFNMKCFILCQQQKKKLSLRKSCRSEEKSGSHGCWMHSHHNHHHHHPQQLQQQPHHQWRPLPLPFKAPLRFRFHLCSSSSSALFLCRSIETGPGTPCCGNPSSGAGRRLVPRPDSNGVVEDGGGVVLAHSACMCVCEGRRGHSVSDLAAAQRTRRRRWRLCLCSPPPSPSSY